MNRFLSSLLSFALMFVAAQAWGQLTCPAGSTAIAPAAAIGGNPSGAICPGTAVNFTGTPTGAGYTYFWDFGVTTATNDTANTANASFSFPTANTSYTVSLRVKKGTGCEVKTVTVTTKGVQPNALLKQANGVSLKPGGVYAVCASSQAFSVSLTTNNPVTNAGTINYVVDWGDGTANGIYTGADINGNGDFVTHSYSFYGYKTITITTTNQGCTTTQSISLYNGSNPVIGITGPGNTVGLCAPASLTFPITYITATGVANPPGTVYEITVNGVVVNTYTHPTTGNPPATYTHNFTATSCGQITTVGTKTYPSAYQIAISAVNPCGTTSAAVAPIRLSSQPVPDFTYAPTTNLCPGNLVTFTDATTNVSEVDGATGNCVTDFLPEWSIFPTSTGTNWTVTSGPLSATNSLGITFLKAGVYTVTMTNPTTACTTAPVSKTITILEPPTATTTFTQSPVTGCADNTVAFTNTSTGYQNSYVWSSNPSANTSFVGSTTSISKDAQIKFTQAGSYSVSLTATNVCTTSTVIVPVVIKAKPTFTLAAILNQCAQSATNTVSVTPAISGLSNNNGTTGPTYAWTYTNGTPATSTTVTPPAGTFSVGQCSVTVAITNECNTTTQSVPFTVTGYPIPTASATYTNATGCLVNGSFVTTFTNTSTPTTGANHTWSISPATGASFSSPTAASPVLTITQPGNYTVTQTMLVVANNCSTTQTKTYPIEVRDKPTVSISAIADICSNSYTATPSGTFVPNNSPITVYAWSFGTGSPSSSTSQTPGSVTFAPGSYSITASATNICGTTTSSPEAFIVTALPLASATFTNQSVGCLNTSGKYPVTFTNTSAPTVAAGATLNWAVAPATGWSFTVGSPSSANPTIEFTAIGTYTVTQTVTAPNSCSTNIKTYTFTIKDKPVVSIAPITSNCVPLTVSPAATVDAKGGTISAYSWSFPKGAPTSSTVLNPSVIYNTGSTDTITFTATNECGVSTAATRTVTAQSLQTVSVTPTSVSVCQNAAAVTLTGSPSGGVWSSATSGLVSTSGVISTGTVGSFSVKYSVGSGACLVESSPIPITIKALPSITPGAAQTVCANSAVITLAATPAGGTWKNPSGTTITSVTPTNTTQSPIPTTYTYSYTDPTTQCSNSATRTITVNPLPVVTVNPTTVSYCSTATVITLPTASPTGGTWSGTGIVSGSAGTFNSATAGVGSHTLTYSYTNPVNGCANTATLAVAVTAPAQANAGIDAGICQNAAAIALTGTPAAGIWSGQGVSNSGGTYSFNPSGLSGAITLTYKVGQNDCETQDTRIMTVNLPPTATANNTGAKCVGEPAAIGLSAGSGTGYTYAWSGPNSYTSTLQNPTLATPVAASQAGSYTVSVKDANNCVSTATTTVVVNTLPNVQAGNDLTFCVNTVAQALPAATPTGGTWSGSTAVSGNTFTPATATTGTTLTYTFTDGNGCMNTDNITVIVNTPQNVAVGAPQEVCFGAAAITVNAATPFGGTWSGSGITANQSTAGTATFTPGSLAAGAYTLTYSTAGTGTCLRTGTVVMTIKALPTLTMAAPQAVCHNTPSITLAATPAGGTWKTPSGTTITSVAPTNTTSAAITTTYTYTYTDATTQCSNSGTQNITVNPLPVVNAGGDLTFCVSNTPQTLTSTTPPTGGTWSGSSAITGNTFTPSTATAGTVLTYSFTDGNGCTNTDAINVVVTSPTNVIVGAPQEVCFGAAAIQVNAATPAGGTWSGQGITANQSTAGTATFTPGSLAAGVYPIKYSIGTGTCLREGTVNMTINPLPTVNAGSSLKLCADTANFTLSGQSPTTGGTGVWMGTGVNTAGLVTVNSLVAGTNTLTYTFTDLKGCIKADTRIITKNTLPTVNAGKDTTYCNISTAQQLPAVSPTPGVWSGLGVTNTASGQFTPTTAGIGVHKIAYTHTDSKGCKNRDTVQVTVASPAVVNAGTNQEACFGAAMVQLSGATPAGGKWSGSIVSQSGLVTVAGNNPQNYVLTYNYGAGSCLVTDTLTFKINPLPNTDAGQDLKLCEDTTNFTLSGQSPTAGGTGVWMGTGVNTAGLVTINSLVAGTNTLTYTFTDLKGCIKADTRIITKNTLPTVNAGKDTTYCNISTAQQLPAVSPTPGVWSGLGVTNTASGQFTPTTAGIGVHKIAYTHTDSKGCKNRDTVQVTVANPQTIVTSGSPEVCFGGAAITVSATPSGGTWSGTGVSATGIFTPGTNPAATYPLVYTFGAGSCLVTGTKNVVINPLPTVNAGASLKLCADTANFVLSGQSPTTGGTGVWSGTGVNNAGLVTIDSLIAGANTLTYTFTDPKGCIKSDTRIITKNALPTVNAGNDTSYCNINVAQPLPKATPLITASTTGVWSGLGVVVGTNTFVPATAGVGSHTVYYTFKDIKGCINKDSLSVQIDTLAIVNAGVNQEVCYQGAAVQLPPAKPTTGTWSGTGVSPTGLFTPGNLAPNNYILTYSVGANSCLVTDTLTFKINPLPPTDAGLDLKLCADTTNFTLSGQSPTAGGTGAWSGTGVNTAGLVTISALAVGQNTLTYTFTDGKGCSKADTRIITKNALPTVNAGNDTSYCNINAPQPLPKATPLITASTTGIWSGVGVVASTNTFVPATAGVGSHTVYYTFKDIKGCINKDSLSVQIDTLAIVNAGVNQEVCYQGAAVQLPPAKPTTGIWSGTGVSPTGLFTPGNLAPNNYTLTYSVGANSCLVTDTLTFKINPLPPTDAGLDLKLCEDTANFKLSGFSPITNGTGKWMGGTSVDSAGNVSINALAIGNNTLKYTFTDLKGCVNSDTMTVRKNALPVVFAGNDTSYCVNPVAQPLPKVNPTGGTWTCLQAAAIIPNPSVGLFVPQTAGLGISTVVYLYQNPIGCKNRDTLLVTVSKPDSVSAGPDQEVCENGGILQLTGYYPITNGTWTGSPALIPNTNTFDPAVIVGGGVANITYSTGSGSCQVFDSKLVTVHPTPIVEAGDTLDVCISTAMVPLTAGTPAGGTWSGDSVKNNQFFPPLAGVGKHTLTYSFTDQYGCTNTDTTFVRVQPLPSANFTAPKYGCLNVPIPLGNTSTGNALYFWKFGDGATSSLANPSHTYTQTGIYTVTLISIGLSPAACKDSMKFDIEIIDIPTAAFTQVPDSGCAKRFGGGLIAIDVKYTDTSTPWYASYLWDFGNKTTDTTNMPPLQYFPQGKYDTVYHISLTLTNICGTSVAKDSVLVRPLPQVNFAPNVNSGCSPLQIVFGNASWGNPKKFFWDLGNGITTTDSVPKPQKYYAFGKDSLYVVTLILTNHCGADTDTAHIRVFPQQITALFNITPTVGCAPLTVNVKNFSNAPFTRFDFGDGSQTSQPIASHTYTQPGIYWVSQYANNGCSYDTLRVKVSVYAPPKVDFSVQVKPACVGAPIAFIDSSQGVTGYHWNFGVPNISSDTSQFKNPTFVYDSAGVYTVSLTAVSDTNNCPATATHPVVVHPKPRIVLVPSDTIGCVKFAPTFSNQSQGQFHAWILGNGETSVLAEPRPVFDSAGAYLLYYTNIDGLGCRRDTTLTMIASEKPVAAFTPSLTEHCGAPVMVSYLNQSTGTPPLGYAWTFGDGGTATVKNPVHQYIVPDTFLTRLITTNAFGCRDTADTLIYIFPQPLALFTHEPPIGCVPLTVQFQEQSLTGTVFRWLFGDGAGSTLPNPIHQYVKPDTYDVAFHVSYFGRCADSIVVKEAVQALTSPIAEFVATPVSNIPLDGSVEFTNYTKHGNYYSWHFGDGDTSIGWHPVHRYYTNDSVYVTLYATNDLGCHDTITHRVAPFSFGGLQIPNAFAPLSGANGLSRVFKPAGVGLKAYHITVYSTWGDVLWESTALENGIPSEHWDGRDRHGQLMDSDSFVWKVHTAIFVNDRHWEGMSLRRGEEPARTGTLTLIR